ncbi:hypothetical protein FQV26_00065 [Planococcus sp. CPCC 101016]|uniref:hypothetical protein n=1 Tax=Planococcus sp. CPCC 101016 TaxID=2599617 RepID=UPI0011B774DF|nr:hypothetical protein [Planococcus sp. CPCC 101016]TWT06244.1 hypothetical protein FQV26_00065 [Planococcus sp. CPCC 101016]
MYIQIGAAQILRIAEIIAVIQYENKMPAAFVRLLVPKESVKSLVVTEDFTYGSPYRTQALLKKIEENRL